MTLRARFAAAAGIAVALVAIGLAGGAYLSARSTLRGQIDDALNQRASAFIHGPAPDHDAGPGGRGSGAGGDNAGGPPDVPLGGAGGTFQLIAASGEVSRPGGETAVLPVGDAERTVAASGRGRVFADARVDGVHVRVLTVGTGASGAVQVARPLTEVDASLSRLLLVLGLLAAAGVVLAALLGMLVARGALRPVERFTRRTEAIIGDPDLSHRLEVRGGDELGRLARSFNGALDALERSVEAQRHLVADASHELRTPIASLRANVQLLEQGHRLPADELRGVHADIIAELDELTALVGDIVELARGTRTSDAVDDVRLDLITDSLAERFARRSGDAVTFRTTLAETITRGDGERIARAVSNLLDNACKWSPAGGVVEVTLADGTLVVRDHGPGFAVADIPHVFDRFYRADSARGKPGSGLGLAIVRQTAESHGGAVAAANAPDGGAVVRVRFAPQGA